MNLDWDGRMKAEALKLREMRVSLAEPARVAHRLRILRIALEAIYGTPELTLVEARNLARQALEDTE